MKSILEMRTKAIGLILTCLLSLPCVVMAQSGLPCLQDFQLLKLQTASIDQARQFLSETGWRFAGSGPSSRYSMISASVRGDVVEWVHGNGFNRIFKINVPGKSGIVIFLADDECMRQQISSASKRLKSSTRVEEGLLVTMFADGQSRIEFQQAAKGYDLTDAVIVYNPAQIPRGDKVFVYNTGDNRVRDKQSSDTRRDAVQIEEVETDDEVDDEKVFTVVEEMPTFPGGEEKLFDYLRKNIKFPPEAREKGIQGRVFITFVIDRYGKVKDAKVLRGIGGGCDEEALRVIRNMPDWKAGKQNGRSVNVQYNLPINFTSK